MSDNTTRYKSRPEAAIVRRRRLRSSTAAQRRRRFSMKTTTATANATTTKITKRNSIACVSATCLSTGDKFAIGMVHAADGTIIICGGWCDDRGDDADDYNIDSRSAKRQTRVTTTQSHLKFFPLFIAFARRKKKGKSKSVM